LAIPLWILDSSLLFRTATIVRNARHVTNRQNFEARILESADSRFTTTTGTLDADIHLVHAEVERLASGSFGSELGSERCALARALETGVTRRAPSDHVTASVGNGNDCVVEGSVDAGNALDVDTLLALLDLNFFSSGSDRSFGSGGSSSLISSSATRNLLTSSC
jgi:hypothetical protein